MDTVSKIKDFLNNEDAVEKAALSAVDFAIVKGVVMRTRAKPESSEVLQHAPFTIFPSPVSRKLMEQALNVQEDFNHLMHVLSRDYEFLKASYDSLLESDEFTKNLFDIYEIIRKEKPDKPGLAVIRSDYMFDQQEPNSQSLKQIEVNTISVSFNGIGTQKMRDVHTYTLSKNGFKDSVKLLPKNDALPNIAQGLVDGWNYYGKANATIVFVVTKKENNIFDQRTIEFQINDINQDICVKRYTLTEIASFGKLDENSNLIIEGKEVAVLLYRAGYMPKDYTSQKDWDARLMMERSNALNCPSVSVQLVGAKKMQQIIAKPGVLEKFIKDSEAVKRVRDTFVGFYGLEMGSEGDAAVEKVVKNPDNYVLKPQLEGGGNNLYGQDMVDKLKEIGGDKRRCSYIIMEKVRPMPVTTVILRAGSNHFKPVEGVSELGVFGVFLTEGDKILKSSCSGHLLRTKASHHEDGGVVSGIAVLDSPLLVD